MKKLTKENKEEIIEIAQDAFDRAVGMTYKQLVELTIMATEDKIEELN